MAEDLIPHSEVQEGATIVRVVPPEPVQNNHVSAPNANANFVTPVTNGKTEVKGKNWPTTVKGPNEIIAGKELTFTVTHFKENDAPTLKKDKEKTRWVFWVDGIVMEPKKVNIDRKRTRSVDSNYDFIDETDPKKLFTAVKDKGYYATVVDNEKENPELKITFSKWLDGKEVHVEAYRNKPNLKKGAKTVVSLKVKATPEILDAYWLNAAGRKITQTGYKQEAYLFLKTLGLHGKTIEAQVFDRDLHPNPIPLSGTDDKVAWKNNKIKIEDREVFKQFKVGDKSRYKEAQQDEEQEQPPVVGIYDFNKKTVYDLQLYIHIANGKALKIKDLKTHYGALKLTTEEKINDAFFAQIETEKVQADAPEVKDKKTKKYKLPPKAKVPYYEKLDNGVIGQKIQLVAQCTNLEGKEVVFKIYEKEKILVEKDKELPVFQKDKKVTEIKATVTDGFATADIELKYSKEQKDNKDWLKKLKNGFYDTTGKTSNLFIKVEPPTETILSSKLFLRQNPFKFISNNWHEPVDDPQICIWNSSGIEKPQSNTFGTGRGRLHTGLDIFSIEKTNAYACLDGTVYERKWHSGYGWTITIKIDNPNELANRRREYTHAYNTDKDSGSKFKEDKNPIYLFYAHLHDIFVKKGQKIKAGKKIGLTGISGVKGGTYDPHLHFNIFSTVYAVGKEYKDYLADPALYVYWKTEKQLTNNEKQIQKTRKDKGKNSSKTFFKPKLSI
ncbi:M23 family metallopeptidase [uncultured Algibacter sp.]|uniref:M23 family metallopeptidase n=1 Tax=uncultured Algibacter sp. TaxID=298659 RepID=UPI0032167148